eukprot:15305-Heterococcus_DN1.PRE.5
MHLSNNCAVRCRRGGPAAIAVVAVQYGAVVAVLQDISSGCCLWPIAAAAVSTRPGSQALPKERRAAALTVHSPLSVSATTTSSVCDDKLCVLQCITSMLQLQPAISIHSTLQPFQSRLIFPGSFCDFAFSRCNDEIPQVDHIIEPLRYDAIITRANGTAANIYKQQQRSTTNSALTAAVAAAPAEKLPEARKFSLSQHSCSSLMGFQTQQIKFIDTIRAHVVLGKLLILFVICHPASAASFDSKAYLANKWRNHHLAHMGGSVGLTDEADRRVQTAARRGRGLRVIAKAARALTPRACDGALPASNWSNSQLAFVAPHSGSGLKLRSNSAAAKRAAAVSRHRVREALLAPLPATSSMPRATSLTTMLLGLRDRSSANLASLANSFQQDTSASSSSSSSSATSGSSSLGSSLSSLALNAMSIGSGPEDAGNSLLSIGGARRFFTGVVSGAQDKFDDAASFVGCALLTHPISKKLLSGDEA